MSACDLPDCGLCGSCNERTATALSAAIRERDDARAEVERMRGAAQKLLDARIRRSSLAISEGEFWSIYYDWEAAIDSALAAEREGE